MSDAPTILILILGHFASAPRAQKEAQAMRESGATVLVRGAWTQPALATEDLAIAARLGVEFAPLVDLRERGLRSFMVRLLGRISRELYVRTGLHSPRVYGISAPEMLRAALRLNADLTMVHCEPGLWVGEKLLRKGKRVGVDFEDWFSQDLREEDRKGRPVDALRRLERIMTREADVCLTTTSVLAEALARDAASVRTPVAVPNSFPVSGRIAARSKPGDDRPRGISFHWFSQTIGPGRGLETLAKALPKLRGDWQVSLRGALRSHEAWFRQTFPPPVAERVTCLDTVPNDELLARIMTHDVGLALEEPYCANKDLTASNKIFEYLRGGLAVIATRTRGQIEVMSRCERAGILIPPDDPDALAAAMQAFIDGSSRLAEARNASLAAGEMEWSWERHAPILQNALVAVLEGR